MTPFPKEKTLTLLQLSGVVKSAVDSCATLRDVWVTAEVSDLRHSGGHVYMVLVEKDTAGNITARLRATMWRGTVAALSMRQASRSLRELLADGNEVRLRGSVQYHPQFGISYNISDIDPDYVRDTSRLQLEILAALRREGIEGLNKTRELTFPPQRIAIISAENAAGYGDFMDQLSNNNYGLQFYTHTFPAVMQGTRTAASILDALERIEMCIDLFDCVVIIRGGGASTDLAGFDDMALARGVAQFPLPIAVGIGHERDNTVLDYIAHTRLKTPTAVAEWLVGMSLDALAAANAAAQQIARYVQQRLQGEQRQVEHLQQLTPILARHAVDTNAALLARVQQSLPLMVVNRLGVASAQLQRASTIVQSSAGRRLALENERLRNIAESLKRDSAMVLRRAADLLHRKEELVAMLDPRDTLRRGYSITRVGGKAVRNASDVAPGEEIVTTLFEGTVKSTAK